MKQKQNVIFIILMGILFFPLNVWSGGTESALSGYYEEINGDFDRVYINGDTLIFYMERQLWMESKETELLELAVCRMQHACGNLYEINCFEQPDMYVLNRMEVIRDTLPDMPVDSLLIRFELDSTLQRYTNPEMYVELGCNYKFVRKKMALETDFTVYIPSWSRDSEVFNFSIQPDYANWGARYKPPRNIGISELRTSLTQFGEIRTNGANLITVKLNGFSVDLFDEFYIAGEYVYCDGETLRWRDLTFKKTSDKRYEKLPRVGRPLK